MMMWWRSANSAFALLLAGSACAQPADDLLVRMRRAYQDQSSVYLSRNTTYVIERSKESWVARLMADEDELMLKDHSGAAHEKSIHFSGLIPLDHLEAYTLVPSGNKRKRVPVENISHRDERDGHIFHDDDRVASFTMPSLVSGSIAHVSHGLRYPDPRFAGGHFFAAGKPIEESTLTVISDPGAEVEVRLFHVADSLIERSEGIEKGKRVQRFIMRKVPPITYEPGAPAARYFVPHAQLVVRTPDGKALSDLDRLYEWYSGFIKEAFEPVAAELKALSDSICGTAVDDRSKAERIYRWVQDHIHYVAIEDGMNGLVPMPAAQVCQARYGDCKGMSGLLVQLLRAQGLQAHMAWIGTRELPYRYSDLPTGANDNHMIAVLALADTTLFLDATANYNAFGTPSGFTQGKQVLIGLAPDRYELKEVPVMPASFSAVRDSVRMRLDGESLSGSGVATYAGYERYDLAHRLRHTPPAKRTESLRPILMKGSNKFLLDSAWVEGLDDPSAPITIHYRFRLPDHARTSAGKRFLALCLSDPWKELRVPANRTLPVELEHRVSHQYVTVLEAPPGSRCSALPPPAQLDHPAFRYDIRIEPIIGGVMSTASFTLDELLLDDELPAWRSACNGLQMETARSIVIETD